MELGAKPEKIAAMSTLWPLGLIEQTTGGWVRFFIVVQFPGICPVHIKLITILPGIGREVEITTQNSRSCQGPCLVGSATGLLWVAVMGETLLFQMAKIRYLLLIFGIIMKGEVGIENADRSHC